MAVLPEDHSGVLDTVLVPDEVNALLVYGINSDGQKQRQGDHRQAV